MILNDAAWKEQDRFYNEEADDDEELDYDTYHGDWADFDFGGE